MPTNIDNVEQFSKNNHYVSQGYLKPWEVSPGKIFVYGILVPHEKVPIWSKKSIRGIGFQEHLYTRHIAGSDNDEIERWFSSEFETPAKRALQKVLADEALSPEDWRLLVRYLAMHDVRTPARLVEYLDTIVESTSNALSEIVSELPEKLEAMKRRVVEIPTSNTEYEEFPLRVTTKFREGEDFGTLEAETHVGRASWIWAIQHALSHTANVLHQHRWTIMRPSKALGWFTTDKPVIRLNYYADGKYDFNGGWAKDGGEIVFPLSPQHMLYTRIGHRPPARGTRFSREHTLILRRLIAEHAHRYVFAQTKDVDVQALRPRTINCELFNSEKDQWKRWHAEQLESERYLFPDRRTAP